MKKNNYFIFGKHAVLSALVNTPNLVLEIYAGEGFTDSNSEFTQQADSFGFKLQVMDRKKMDTLTNNAAHQNIVAKVRSRPSLDEFDLEQLLSKKERVFLLVLDGITDAHNLGSCLRNADAAGVDAVIIPKNNAATLSPAVYKIASGAASTVDIISVTNLSRTLAMLKKNNVWVFGAAGESATDVSKVKFTESLALVLGAEGKGMRDLTKKHCDFLVSLPMHGYVSSLNVAVASGVLLYEAQRQRNQI